MKSSAFRIVIFLLVLLASLAPAAAAVTGSVVSDAGSPIVGAVVRAYAPESRAMRLMRLSGAAQREPLGSAITDRSGAFTIDARDTCDIEFLSDGYAPQRLRARNGEDLGGIVLAAAQPRAGRVVANNSPVAEATVRFIGEDGAEWTTRTDQRGEYTLPDPTAWSSEAYVTAANLGPLHVVRDTGPRMNVNFALAQQMSTTGRVAASGHDAIVTLAAGGVAKQASLRPDGTFSIDGLGSAADEAWIDGQPAAIMIRNGTVLLSPDSGLLIRVSSSRGAVEGADMILTSIANPSSSFRETSASGRRIATPPPGSYRLHVGAPGYVSRDEEIEIVAGMSFLEVELEDSATVAGTVVDRTGRGIAAAFVIPTDVDGNPLVSGVNPILARSGRDGRFVLRGLRPAELRFSAFRQGYGRAATDRPFVAMAGSVSRGITIELVSSVTVTGEVVNESGEAVVGARISFVSGVDDVSAITGQDGRFETRTAEGVYDVVVQADGFAKRSISTLAITATSRPLSIHMRRAYQVSGTVERRGRPLAGVDVTAVSGDVVLFSVTTEEGGFSFELPAGVATLTAGRQAEVARVVRNVTVPLTGSITLESDSGRQIRGRVVDKVTREGIDDFEVRIAATDAGMTSGTTEVVEHHEGGTFVVENVPSTPIRLAIVSPGRAPLISKVIDASNDDVIEFALEEPLSVAGVVTDSRGRPLEDVQISVSAADIDLLTASTLKPAFTNDRGEYVLLDVRQGDELLFRKENFSAVRRAVSSNRTRVDVTMDSNARPADKEREASPAPVASRNVRGVVSGIAQDEIPLTLVHVGSSSAGERVVPIDSDGRFSIDGLAGEVSIYAQVLREDGSSKSSRVIVSRGVDTLQLQFGVAIARGTVINKWAGGLLSFATSGDPSGYRAVARVRADATFDIEGLEPGLYLVVAQNEEATTAGVATIDESGNVSLVWQ